MISVALSKEKWIFNEVRNILYYIRHLAIVDFAPDEFEEFLKVNVPGNTIPFEARVALSQNENTEYQITIVPDVPKHLTRMPRISHSQNAIPLQYITQALDTKKELEEQIIRVLSAFAYQKFDFRPALKSPLLIPGYRKQYGYVTVIFIIM